MVGSAEDIKRHLDVLKRRDKRIAAAIKFAGLPEPRDTGGGFARLINIIGNQQVSTAAGQAIWAKLKRNAGGRVTAGTLLKLGESGMRASGFSGQKARYALGLAEAVDARKLNFKALERADDDTVRATLTAYKGIGTWTADIYLMFGMGRPDIWPVGDLALQIAVQMLHGLEARPSARELVGLGEGWRPYRSSVSLLLWRYYGANLAKRAAATKAK
jgi:DNA-3-methyladenine glycosylase II